ncbi:hypothetical protein ZWY2020_004074 [Hordeum vulgare]|nr:hypothetical protein ZWY2020_004074 [Hordeum vulgare]
MRRAKGPRRRARNRKVLVAAAVVRRPPRLQREAHGPTVAVAVALVLPEVAEAASPGLSRCSRTSCSASCPTFLPPCKLEEELDGWLSAAALTKSPDVRAVIAPHAGYSYSGRCAAYAFGNIDPTNM